MQALTGVTQLRQNRYNRAAELVLGSPDADALTLDERRLIAKHIAPTELEK